MSRRDKFVALAKKKQGADHAAALERARCTPLPGELPEQPSERPSLPEAEDEIRDRWAHTASMATMAGRVWRRVGEDPELQMFLHLTSIGLGFVVLWWIWTNGGWENEVPRAREEGPSRDEL